MGYAEVVPVVGRAAEEVWSQVAVVPKLVGGGAKLVSRPLWLVALTMRGEGAENSGPKIIENLSEGLRGCEELEETKELVERVVEKWGEDLSLVVVGLIRDKAWILGMGGAKVVWQRGEKLGAVLSAEEKGVEVREGRLFGGDRMILGTEGLLAEMSKQLMVEVLGEEKVGVGGGELVTRVQAAEESGDAAGMVVYVTNEEEKEENSETGEGGEEEEVGLKVSQVMPEKARPKIFLRRRGGRKGRLMVMGLVVLVLLGASLALGWRERKLKEERAGWDSLQTAVEAYVTKVAGLGETDRVVVTAGFDEVWEQVMVAEKEATWAKRYEKELTSLKEKLNGAKSAALGEKELESVPTWFDLGIVRENFFGTAMALIEGKLVILDREKMVLVSLDPETKEAQLVGGGELLTAAQLVTGSRGRALVYGVKGIVDLNMVKKTAGILVEPDEAWQRTVALALFSGNVYMLDAGAGEIWLYPGLASGVGEKRRWLTEEIDLSGATDMAIDGDIWVLKASGEVERLRRGAREQFTIKGLAEPMEEGTKIFTNEELRGVYILDQKGKQVVVVSKEGEYVKRYRWQGLASVSEIAADEAGGALYALSGATVYRIGLE